MIIVVSVMDVMRKRHPFSLDMFGFSFVGKYKSKKYKFTMSCSSSLYLVSLVADLNYISLFTCSQAIIDRYGRYTVSLRTLHTLHYTRNNIWYRLEFDQVDIFQAIWYPTLQLHILLKPHQVWPSDHWSDLDNRDVGSLYEKEGCEQHEYSLCHRFTDCSVEVTLRSDCLSCLNLPGRRGVLNS